MNDGAFSATILLRLRIENNNRHLRGKKRAIESIERFVLPIYGETQHLRINEYQIKISYRTDAELDKLRRIYFERSRGRRTGATVSRNPRRYSKAPTVNGESGFWGAIELRFA